jgi:hypothetical protein
MADTAGHPAIYRKDGTMVFQQSAQTNGVICQEVTFTEAGDTTYTGSVDLPAGSTILDIQLQSTALWDDGTSATMKVGDGDDDDGFYTGVDLTATDLLVDEVIRFESTGGVEGAYIVAATGELNSYDPAARTITGVVTTGGQDGTAGRTRMLVVYTCPSNTTAATGA